MAEAFVCYEQYAVILMKSHDGTYYKISSPGNHFFVNAADPEKLLYYFFFFWQIFVKLCGLGCIGHSICRKQFHFISVTFNHSTMAPVLGL